MGIRAPIDHPEDWKLVNLGAITEKIGSGATPRGGSETYLEKRDRFAIVRSQNVFDRRFDDGGLAFISDEQANGLRNVELRPNDLLLNITGDGITFARCCKVPERILPACVNQHVSIIRVDPSKVDADFILAYLTHPEVKTYIESFNAGGSRRAITKGHIESFRLALPTISEQNQIGRMLSTLDAKIEFNDKKSKTLDSMASALFRSWFVEFEPVSAKTEGRKSELARDLFNLFPDRFEDSSLGRIPEGWNVMGLDKLGTFRNGLALQKYPAGEGPSLPAIKIAQLRIGNTVNADRVSKDIPSEIKVEDGDVLFSWSGSLECVVWTSGSGALNQHLFKVTSEQYPKWFYLGWIQHHLPEFRRIAAAKATTMGHIQRHHLREALVAVPPASFIRAASNHFDTLLQASISAKLQSRTLAALRDTLLPKLISGELRVNNPAGGIS
jgi:type I restriction enzyme S subunit